MNKVNKVCSHCNNEYEVLYKKRKSLYCSRRCAYDSRIVQTENRVCQQCQTTFETSITSDKKFCSRDCFGKYYSENYRHSEESKKKMSDQKIGCVAWNKGLTAKQDDRILAGESNPAFGKTYCTKENNPEWARNISNMTKGKINLGDLNGMKQSEARAKVSSFRKKLFEDPEQRLLASERSRKAWAEGKFDGVRVGQCKWHEHIKPDGTKIKVQGTWELAFARWSDSQGLTYLCHRGRIPYAIDGEEHSYYPDFYVEEWSQWVEIKNAYHYSLQKDKFDILQKDGVNVRILFKEDLIELGVKFET